MRTFPRILALAAALAVTTPWLPAAAQPAVAGPTKAQQQEAATRFKKGLELFKDGDYQAALIEFRRANELAPNYAVLYNIGQVYFQLQDYPGALSALERYLSEGGTSVPATRRADVQKDIEKLRARIATLEITTTVPDADVSIDDVSVGRSPLAKPVMVSAGRHKITVSKAGYSTATKIVEVASGDAPKILVEPIEQKSALPTGPIEPPKITPPPPVADNPPPPPVLPPPSRPTPVAGIVVTSGLTVGAVITGILALNASSALKSDRGSANATHDMLSGDSTKTIALAVATDVLTGGAVIALGVTLYVGLSGKKEAPAGAPATPAAPAPAARFTDVRLGVGGNGLLFTGRF